MTSATPPAHRDATGWCWDTSYLNLPPVFYTHQAPTPVRTPDWATFNNSLAESLGLNPALLKTPEGLEAFSGNKPPEDASPIAQAYAGHQFGHFTMLGDGRAVLLGEHLTPTGNRVDIQLKGAGQTHYSRRGDGRAALGPMLREYLISEAMAGLGIPTSRSLAVVTTGEPVYRETPLAGAVLTRVAASHIRVGTFQYAQALGDVEALKALADYTIKRHYPEVQDANNPYLALLQSVIHRQVKLIAGWLSVGFIHGVMNTDNMSIAGETIDYGPCAFMDSYDPATVFSSIDHTGRYAYGNQPKIAQWNLARLAEAILPLLHPDEEQALAMAEAAVGEFSELFRACWTETMRRKLGLFDDEITSDKALIDELLTLLQRHQADFTDTFRKLSTGLAQQSLLATHPEGQDWLEHWQSRWQEQPEDTQTLQARMQNINPAVIPRNHLVEEALEDAVEHNDYTGFNTLVSALQNPYAPVSAELEERFSPPPQDSKEPYRTFCGT